MPYINVKTSAKLDDNTKNNILKKLSKAATLIPGKSEAYVMCEIDDGKAMIFGGDADSACAIAEMKLFGTSSKDVYLKVTQEICKIMNEEAGVERDRCYVKFDEVEYWGIDGFMF